MAKKTPNFYEKIAPVLLVVVIGLAFAVGVLWQKVSELSGGSTSRGTGAVNTNTAGAPSRPTSGKLEEAQAAQIPKVNSEDHIRGSADAQVFLIEYSDFECPYCSSFHPTAKQALAEYGEQFAWVYRHFPLDSIHPKARPAAEASECVTELLGADAFWSFADKVFADQTALVDLSATAVSIGVNKVAFDNCVSQGQYKDLVEAQYQSGVTSGVTGTPGNFIVNSKGESWLVSGAVPYATLKQTIDEALSS